MKLYIPEHLKKVKVINQLFTMYKEYLLGTDTSGERYYKEESDSFEDYQRYKAIDPVKRFVSNWINEETIKEAGMSKDSVISYLVKLFYSLKGTPRVLDYLRIYLGIDLEYSYSSSFLELDIKAGTSEVKIVDKELFLSDLYGFCGELLYFNNNKSNIDKIRINVVEEVKNVIGSNYVSYSHWSATEFNNDNI